MTTSTQTAPESPTVLVVEDEMFLADLYAEWLADRYDVQTAYDGETGVDLVDGEVDVMVLDRRMPKMSGDEALETIRKRGYECRVGLVTAVEPDFDVIEMGFDEYLVKPIGESELQELVERLLMRATYDREIREYFSLVSKRASLEVEKTSAELAINEKYDELLSEIAKLGDRLETTLSEVEESSDFRALVRDLDANTGNSSE